MRKKASITVCGFGETEDDAIDDLLFNMHETARRIEFESGSEDSIEMEDEEDEED